MSRAPLFLLLSICATLGIAAVELRPPTRDLTLPEMSLRRVWGVLRDSAGYHLIADTGERCTVSGADWSRAHPDELWACRWRSA